MTNEAKTGLLVPPRPKVKTGQPTEGLMILVGQPKSGKTSLAASFPEFYVLELEPGSGDRVAGRQEPQRDA